MSSEPEQDANVRELADMIFARIAGAVREAQAELGREDSPMRGWGAALGEAEGPDDLRRVSQELGMSLRESEAGAAFLARMEAVGRIVDDVVEEWQSQRERPADEVRLVRDQADRMVTAKLYEMFGIDPPDRCFP